MSQFSSYQLPPDGSGKFIKTRAETVSAVAYQVQEVELYGMDAYMAYGNIHAIQATNAQSALWNDATSTWDMYVLGLFLANLTASGHAGVNTYGYLTYVSSAPSGTKSALAVINGNLAAPTSSQCALIDAPSGNGTGVSSLHLYGIVTASLEQAAAGACGAWNRNILPWANTGRPLVLVPGSGVQVNYNAADASTLVQHSWLVALAQH